jgi:hypothetical protein
MMKNKISIPTGNDYNKIWKDFKISFFESYTKEKWKEELINIDSVTYEFMKDDVENLFFSTGGYYLQYLDSDSIYKLAIDITASQVLKSISKDKELFFERDNTNNSDKYYLIIQRICNNCKNIFDVNRKVNVILLQTMIMDVIYQNHEIDFAVVLDVEKLSKNEPAKLIFAINKLLNNYDLAYEELIEITHKYNIDSSNFYILNFANQFRNLKKASNNQIIIDFMEVA